MNKHKNKRFREARFNKGHNVERDHYSNPVFKNLEHPSVLWGRHAVIAALRNPKRILRRIFCSPNNRSILDEEVSKIRSKSPRSFPDLEVLPIHELNLLVPSDSVHQGFVTISEALQEPNFDAFLEKTKTTCHLTLVLLDQVTDPQNVGAIARSFALRPLSSPALTVHASSAVLRSLEPAAAAVPLSASSSARSALAAVPSAISAAQSPGAVASARLLLACADTTVAPAALSLADPAVA